jgi:glycosyltransferase involved in cell wall biosynthesis
MTKTQLAEQAYGARCERASTGRRRILLAVHSAKLGGAERMALLEAEYLNARFELLLSVPDGPLRARFAEHGELVGWAETLPLWGTSLVRWTRSSIRTLRDALVMAMLIRRRRVELVLTNSSVCLAAVLAARLARVPVVVHARDVPKSRLAPLVMGAHGRLASTVIVIADGLTPYFRSEPRFRAGPPTRIARIPDGISVPALAQSHQPSPFGSPLQLCLVGALDPRKGQDVAVAALAQLRQRGIAAKLDLVGRELDEGFAGAVREQAQALGVAGEVSFVGEVSDIGPLLQRADIVIAPSRGEWTPLVLMEALAHGKPVVAARVGGVAEVVHHRESGLLIAPESPSELAEAIVELSEDPAVAVAMAERGHAHVAAEFRVEHTLERVQSEIDRLLDGESMGLRREPRPLQSVL